MWRKKGDETGGIEKEEIIEERENQKGNNLKPLFVIQDGGCQVVEITYRFNSNQMRFHKIFTEYSLMQQADKS